MNISLTKPKPKTPSVAKSCSTGNVFDDGSDDDDQEQQQVPITSRASVNLAIAQEQEALRQRAQAALKQVDGTDKDNIYDYDAAYESIESARNQEKEAAASKRIDPEGRKSRYIGDLLKASQERKFQREVAMERKIAKEQEAEAQLADYRDKEEYVTASYKRKLQERQLWLEKEEERARNEGTVESKGMGGFYGGLHSNVALGNARVESDLVVSSDPQVKADRDSVSEPLTDSKEELGLGFSEGFERAADGGADSSEPAEKLPERPVAPAVDERRAKRQLIEQKIAEALRRYLERHSMADERTQ